MPTTIELAQLANRVYSRTPENRTPRPTEWNELTWQTDDPITGFSYGAYKKGGEIVISFTGSNENLIKDFGLANIPAGAGLSSIQICQAAIVTLEIMQAHPEANISFTGHSLGGGLASVMAIYFNKEATTFDPAPFELSARNPVFLAYLQSYLIGRGYNNTDLIEYTKSLGDLFTEREGLVHYHYIDGEILQFLRTDATNIGSALPATTVGTQSLVDGISAAGRTSLHSMSLLAAMLTSTKLNEITPKIPILLELVFDNLLYARDPQYSTESNFIDKLYIAQISNKTTPLLDNFATDLNKLISDEGTSGKPDLQKALIVAAMDYYYWNSPSEATGLFESGSEGIHFNLSDIPGENAKSIPLLAEAISKLDEKSAHFVRSYAQDAIGWHIQSGTGSLNWTASSSDNQAAIGGTGADAVAGSSGQDLLMGLAGADTLQGKAGSDLLVGGDDADQLDGGDDSDYLYGGVGSDEYVFTGDFGNDWINDSDGSGRITVDGTELPAGNAKKISTNIYKDNATGWTFSKSSTQADGTSTLIITKDGKRDSSIVIHNWQSGQLGITLNDTEEEIAPSDRFFRGDQRPLAISSSNEYDWDSVVWDTRDGTLSWPETSTVEENFADVIRGTTRNDDISGLGGNDALSGRDGQDKISGGTGDDLLSGGAGSDTIIGGEGNDQILGGFETSVTQHYRTTDKWTAPADALKIYISGPTWGVYQKNTEEDRIDVEGISAADDKADFIDGGAGNDHILASFGNDFVSGGADNDSIVGLGGSDILNGDAGNDSIEGDGVTESGFLSSVASTLNGNDILDGGAGNDYIIGGGGQDTVIGGDNDDLLWGDGTKKVVDDDAHGRDLIDGGGGNDQLMGGGENDQLFGGDGQDSLWGDGTQSHVSVSIHGRDLLDGGAGDDILIGGGKSDTLIGDDGADTIWGDDIEDNVVNTSHDHDYLSGGKGNDKLYGGGENDVLSGGEDNDILYGDDIETRVSSSVHGNDLLMGEKGKDTLHGGGKDDTLFGGTEDDILWGDGTSINVNITAHGKDLIEGGEGADQLVGGGAGDQLFGGAGADTIFGDDETTNVEGSAHGADLIDGGDGDDVICGDGGNDTLIGGSGNDFIAGEHQTSPSSASQGSTVLGDDLLLGGDGNDVLLGGEGNDTLDGGIGSDTLVGGAGSDLYHFGYGSGADVINLTSSDGIADVIQVDAGLDENDITFTRTSTDLVLSINDGSDQITLKEFFTRGIDTISFGGGITFIGESLASKTFRTSTEADSLTGYIQPEFIFGDAGNDQILGNGGNDTLNGGIGNDSLAGGAGADTYVFNITSGRDTIDNYDTDSIETNADIVALGDGFTVENTKLVRSGDDLIIQTMGTGDSLTIKSYFKDDGASKYSIESIQFADNTVWDVATVKNKALVGAADPDFLRGYASNDTLSGGGGSDYLYGGNGADHLTGGDGNDQLNGENGDDTLAGGLGNDTIAGGLGNNTYVFSKGNGRDFVASTSDTTAGRHNTLQFESGVTSSQISVKRSLTSDSLLLSINGTSDMVAVGGFFNSDNPASAYNPVQQIRFIDGDVAWGLDDIKAKSLAGDETGQHIIGFTEADSISSAGGGDLIYGQAGDDTIDAGADNDKLYGGIGNDNLNGNDGDDFLSGDIGDDSLTGGVGSDTLNGGLGRNTFMFSRGDGQDVIQEVYNEATDKLSTLLFKTGVTASQVNARREDDALALTITDTSDQVWIEGFFKPTESFNLYDPVQQIKFTDSGIIWDRATIKAKVLAGDDSGQRIKGFNESDSINAASGDDTVYGLTGNDSINAGAGNDKVFGGIDEDSLTGGDGGDYLFGETGNDTLTGGLGNDTLNGGTGNNTYIFGKGDGQDTIDSVYDTTAARIGILQFKTGVSASQVTARKLGAALELAFNDTSDTVRIEGFYTTNNAVNSYNPVQQIKFTDSGEIWDLATIKTKVKLSLSSGGFDDADLINLDDSWDNVDGMAGNDTINAGGGSDNLYGGDGADSLNADDGNDVLYGDAGDDTLIGGLGNDRLQGGTGNNTYVFGRGDGQDIVTQLTDPTVDKLSTLLFKAGVTPSQVTVKYWSAGDFAEFSINGTSDKIVVEHILFSAASPVQQVKFTDGGATWDLAAIKAKAVAATETGPYIVGTDASESINATAGSDGISGKAGNDTINAGAGDDSANGGDGNDSLNGEDGNDSLYGEAGDDTLVGGLGNDALAGGTGNNTYVFGLGDGQDKITEFYDTNSGRLSTLLFKTGVTPSQVTAKRVDSALELSINSTSDKVYIAEFFTSGNPVNAYNPVQQVKFTDSDAIWDLATIKAKVTPIGNEAGQSLRGFDGADLINSAGGSDSVSGETGDDTISAGTGNDVLYGGEGSDSLNGDNGNDLLYGEAGDDTLIGGLGNDFLDGGLGNNIYIFGKGDGQDSISDDTAGALTILQFKPGIAASEVSAKRVDDNLDLMINGTSDKVRVEHFFTSGTLGPQVKFIDGAVTWDLATIKAKVLLGDETNQHLAGYDSADSIIAAGGSDTIYGQGGNDTLNGGLGNDVVYGGDGGDSLTGDDGHDSIYGDTGSDTLTGGLGNDTLNGGSGNNTYVFAKGDGRDKIASYDSTAGKLNTLQFKTGVAASQVSIKRVDNNLELVINGTSDGVSLLDFFAGDNPANEYNPVQQVKFTDGGVTWDLNTLKVKALTSNETSQNIIGLAESDSINGDGGDDSIYGKAGNDTITAGTGNDTLYGGNGNDTLSGEDGDDSLSGEAGDDSLAGGVGYDTLNGGVGNNTYVFGNGDGQDVIQAVYDTTSGKSNTLEFKAGVAASQMLAKRSENSLELSINGSSDKIRIESFFAADSPLNYYNPIQQLKFTDGGVTWDLATIKAKVLFGDETSQIIVGFDGADQIKAAGGSDAVSGQAGDDTLNGGSSNDTLRGGDGADSVAGDDGDDYLYGDAGDDTLTGGIGNDTLSGGRGNNTYIFSKGYGQDTISDVYDTTAGKMNTIQFKSGVSVSQVSVKRQGSNLELSIKDTPDKLVVTNFFYSGTPSNSYNPVQQIQFAEDNITWNLTTIAALANTAGLTGNGAINGTTGADALYGGLSADTLSGDVGADLLFGDEGSDSLLGGSDGDGLYGGNGKDTLDGGVGNDTLVGGTGSDNYILTKGCGSDLINEWDPAANNIDVITFTDVTSTDVTSVTRSGADLVIKYGTSDQVMIQSFFTQSSYTVEQYKFSDGVTWTAADMSALSSALAASGGGSVAGTSRADWIKGISSNDSLSGAAESDYISGGDGNDAIDGGDGNDWLSGDVGIDSILGGNGDDKLFGGSAGLSSQDVSSLVVYAKGTMVGGVGPNMEVWIDGVKIQTFAVNSTAYTAYTVTTPLGMNAKSIDIAFTNDAYSGSEDRNLYVEKIVVSGETLMGNAPGVVMDYGSGTGAFDWSNVYRANGSIGSNGSIRFGLSDNDYLNGGAGIDRLTGGVGNDIYIVDHTSDQITELTNEGYDFVESNVNYTLSGNLEQLTLTGTTNINGTGNALNNMMVGNSGLNQLDGGAGADFMVGGGGNDTYIVDTAGDVCFENTGAGVDLTLSSVTYTLNANVENLKLTGTAAITATGNSLANELTGNAANNTLNGGAGDDTLDGGAGTATRPVSSLVVFAKGTLVGGVGPKMEVWVDGVRVQTFDVNSTTYQAYTVTAPLGMNAKSIDLAFTNDAYSGSEDRNLYVEKIVVSGETLMGNAQGVVMDYGSGTGAFDWSNVYRANGSIGGNGSIRFGLGDNDYLNGGAGIDRLTGGVGNDIYIVDHTSDQITELANEGYDFVESSVNYALSGNLEQLTLTGTTNINGTGNALNNMMVGNSGINQLDGGAGADFMVGGGGNDTYIVDTAGDVCYENVGAGVDTVKSSITYTLGSNLENLTLTGTTAINGVGNSLANELTGNSANNTLYGGAGNDLYRGGAGADSFSDSDTTSADRYVWGRNEGSDTLNDAGGSDQLDVLAGVSADQLWLQKSGNNLILSVIGTSDKVTINNWYANAANQVEVFKLADGKSLSNAKVDNLVNAMASFTPPTAGQTTLPASYQTSLNGVIAANWQ